MTLRDGERIAEPALVLQREVHARQSDDQMHKQDLCMALVAKALSTPDQARALIDQARISFQSLPVEAQGLASSKLVQGLILDAPLPNKKQ